MVLLALAGGLVGAWIVLSRLAFYSHAVGSATFPGLVTADATGFSAPLLALAVALGYAGGVGGARRAGRESEAATALLLVAALALGVVLASDVFESGASVDRLLFGTLLGLDGSDLVLSGACAAGGAGGEPHPGTRLDRDRVRPGGRPRARACRPARADLALLALVALAAVAAIPAVGALLVGAVFVLPAAAARLVARSVPALIAWAVALALAETSVGLYLAYWLDAPPGPPIAVLGRDRVRRHGDRHEPGPPAARRRDAMSDPLVAVEGLAVGYGSGAPALREVTFAAAAGQSVCVLGPNGGGKTTLFRALLGELRPATGTLRVAGRPAYLAQTERTRLDFPVSAVDVALMGTLAAGAWWRPPRREARDRAERALARVGLADRSRVPFGELSGGERRRALLARSLVLDAQVLLLDEPLAGVDPASAELISSVFQALREEGRTLLVSTHDVGSARSFDRVLCLNGRQVAFGAPGEVLGRETLEATYGQELIVLSDDGREQIVTVQHHHH